MQQGKPLPAFPFFISPFPFFIMCHSRPLFCHPRALYFSSFPTSPVIPDFTAQTSRPRWGFDVRKAMNLDTIETVPSGDDCGLGGIGESINTQFHLTFTQRPTTRSCVFAQLDNKHRPLCCVSLVFLNYRHTDPLHIPPQAKQSPSRVRFSLLIGHATHCFESGL